MKRASFWGVAAVVVVAVIGLLWWGFAGRRTENGKEEEKPANAQPAPIKRLPTGEATITLDAATQQRMGLSFATLVLTNVATEIKGYGHVTDPAALASLVNELATAQAAAEASRKEFERLKTLQQQDNASVRALQTAEAAARRDELLVRSAQDRIRLGYGSVVARQVGTPGFLDALVTLSNLLIRVDLPAGAALNTAPGPARIVPLSREDRSQPADFLEFLPAVDPQMQGQGLLFLARTNGVELAAGLAVTAYLQVPGERQSGAVVPRAAIVRFADRPWVYAQTDSTTFMRRPVALEQPLEAGWLATGTLASGTRIVVAGAQELLSAELVSSMTGEGE